MSSLKSSSCSLKGVVYQAVILLSTLAEVIHLRTFEDNESLQANMGILSWLMCKHLKK